MNLSNQAAAGSIPSLTEIDTRNGFQGPDFILEGVHHPTSALGSATDSSMYRYGRGLMRRGARYEEALAVSAPRSLHLWLMPNYTIRRLEYPSVHTPSRTSFHGCSYW
jgi:hypothetical protein